MSKNGNVSGWFTVNGKHIPIMEGETKSSAFRNFVNRHDKTKSAEYKKTLGQARKRFEKICDTTGREDKAGEFNFDKWTLRDFVAEADIEYNIREEESYDYDMRLEGYKYKRFIDAYKDKIEGIDCYQGHGSKKYDSENLIGDKSKIKKPSKTFEVQDPYSGKYFGEYKIKSKMDKELSSMRYGNSVTGYNLKATGAYAKKMKKAGLNTDATSNDYRMRAKKLKYKRKK